MIKNTFLIILSVLASLTYSQQNCVYMASDIYPGSVPSLPIGITEFNGALYFKATGNSSGAELWKYENGVSSMVADINPGSGSSLPNQLTVIGSNLYFTATTPTTGLELYKYDGVSVTCAADIFPGSGGSYISYLTKIGSELYFVANDGVTGMEPWKYDGVSATQVDDINPGIESSSPHEFAGAGGYIYFSAYHPTYGLELWKYDGVSSVVYDLYPGTTSSDLGELTTIGSKICFRATNGTQGYELWVHDGTTATCLDVCTVGPGDFTPWEFTPFGSAIYFRGFIQGTGYELWKFDGTTATMVADILPGSGNSHPNHLSPAGTVLYFAADNGNTGNELMMYDGVNVSLVADIHPGSTGSMSTMVTEKFPTIGDHIYLIANDGVSGNEVWGYDGTTTELGKDIVPGSSSSNPTNLVAFGNSIYFSADDLNSGSELWVWNPDQVLVDTLTVTSCGNYLSPAGNLYTSEGVYDFTDTISSINCPGCDSLISVHLTISNPDTTVSVTSCNDYTSPSGTYYSVQGNYSFVDTIPSIACPGVDSVIHIDLTITDNVNLAIFVFNGVAFVNQSGGTYQWLNCDASYAQIPGATNQDYLPLVDGNYACQITIGTCTDTTDCVYVVADPPAGLTDQENSHLVVYPNPVSDRLFISNNEMTSMTVKIYDLSGSEIFYEQKQNTDSMQIDLSGLTKGIYYLDISTVEGRYIQKVVKE